MAEANDVYGRIYQNLIDAGCDQQTAEQCMVFAEEERFMDMLPILVMHRKALLGSLHERQKQIDCLDYLLYKIKVTIQNPFGFNNQSLCKTEN